MGANYWFGCFCFFFKFHFIHNSNSVGVKDDNLCGFLRVFNIIFGGESDGFFKKYS